jgi:predicted DNA-binding ribbon-helix-helix protein
MSRDQTSKTGDAAPPNAGPPGRASLDASRPVKRSFTIAGHRTSISLESAFWDAFRELCEADGVTMAQRLGEIDRARGDRAGLSGAVRVWVLARYRR